MTTILHISSRADWQSAQPAGSYKTDSLSTQGPMGGIDPKTVATVAEETSKSKSTIRKALNALVVRGDVVKVDNSKPITYTLIGLTD